MKPPGAGEYHWEIFENSNIPSTFKATLYLTTSYSSNTFAGFTDG